MKWGHSTKILQYPYAFLEIITQLNDADRIQGCVNVQISASGTIPVESHNFGMRDVSKDIERLIVSRPYLIRVIAIISSKRIIMRNHYMLILIWFRIIDINLSSRLIPKPFKRCSLFPCTGEILVYSSFGIIGIAAYHFQQVQNNLPKAIVFPC